MLARIVRPSRAARGGAATFGALTFLVACSASPSTDGPPEIGGPISSSPDVGAVCLQVRPGEPHDFTLGFNIVINKGTKPVEIGDVELLDAQDLSITKAWVAVTDAAIGNHSRFPPTRKAMKASDLDWASRADLPGATAEPNVRYNLILQVTATSRFPAAAGIRFTYAAEGEKHAWQTNIGFTVEDPC